MDPGLLKHQISSERLSDVSVNSEENRKVFRKSKTTIRDKPVSIDNGIVDDENVNSENSSKYELFVRGELFNDKSRRGKARPSLFLLNNKRSWLIKTVEQNEGRIINKLSIRRHTAREVRTSDYTLINELREEKRENIKLLRRNVELCKQKDKARHAYKQLQQKIENSKRLLNKRKAALKRLETDKLPIKETKPEDREIKNEFTLKQHKRDSKSKIAELRSRVSRLKKAFHL